MTGTWSVLGLSRWVFLFGLLALPVNISSAQAGFYGALVLWLVDVVRGGRWRVFKVHHLLWLGLFVAAAVASSIHGANGAAASEKLYRLALLLVVFAVPDWFRGRPRDLLLALGALVLGCVVLAFYDFVRVPLQLHRGLRENLADTGNMRDPQFYTATILFLAVGVFAARGWRGRGALLALTVPLAVALLLHQKFGAFLGLGAGMLLVAVCFRRWRTIGTVLGLGVLVLALHGPSRARFAHKMQNEFDPDFGARGTLWRVVGPAFLRDHFWGAGYKATRYEDFVKYKSGRHMEQDLDHLHNNAYQLWAEIGPVGMLAWVLWMLLVLARLFRARGSPFGAAALCALAALLVNGLVEYNFGDSEPYMLFCFLMGVSGIALGTPAFADLRMCRFEAAAAEPASRKNPPGVMSHE